MDFLTMSWQVDYRKSLQERKGKLNGNSNKSRASWRHFRVLREAERIGFDRARMASERPGRLLKNSYLVSRATDLECADNGGALDFLAFLWVSKSKGASRCACRRTPN
jgi:hypothetical protein